jgi:branched-chain amino acid transport system substrate-binding protein
MQCDRSTQPKNNRREILRNLGVAGLSTPFLGGCLQNGSGNGNDGGATQEESTETSYGKLRYGLLEPLSGPYTALGKDRMRGSKLAIKHINENDEFDFTIDATEHDTQADTGTAQQVAQSAYQQDDAQYFSGGISTSVALTLNEFAASNSVVYNPGAAGTPITGQACNEYVFRFMTNTALAAEAIARWTPENIGNKIWFHIADYEYGESVKNQVADRMDALFENFEIVNTTRSKLGTTNFGSYITQISNSEADAAIIGMTGSDLITFIRQAASNNLMEDVALITETAGMRVIRKGLGTSGVGLYTANRYSYKLDSGTNPAFVEAYKNEYDRLPDTFSRGGYESILMTAKGIQEAESVDPEDVKEMLPGMEMNTVHGTNRFRECDHQAVNPVWMSKLTESSNGDLPSVELLEHYSGKDVIPACEETGCER